MVFSILNLLLFSMQHKTLLDIQYHNAIVVTHKGPNKQCTLNVFIAIGEGGGGLSREDETNV